MKQKLKAITNLAPITNFTEARHDTVDRLL